jgi:hypothetical protein
MSKLAFQIFLILLALFASWAVYQHSTAYEFENHSELTKETLRH